MSKFYIVATPIGNLKDITLRALEVLREVDFILAEDTRVTKKLLLHYEISKPLISYHHHSKLKKTDEILNLLREGKNLALVSDAGTPGISDPGNKLVEEILNNNLDTNIIPIPGTSSILTLASIAGISMDRFKFLGFAPTKKGKDKFLKEVLESDLPVIFFESCHRILKTLQRIQDLVTSYKLQVTSYQLVIGRELTKKFETVYRGTVDEVLTQLKNSVIKGEFTVIISKIKKSRT